MDFLPKEYTTTMNELQDSAPTIKFRDIINTIKDDFKVTNINTLFKYFDPNPIGSASIAQVHKAISADTNEQLAVKVQFPKLRSMFKIDMFTQRLMFKLASVLFPSYPNFQLIHDEIKNNLRKELDFNEEANNAEKCKNLFRNDNRVYVPKIYRNLCSDRVVTMEFIDGVKITNVDGLNKLKCPIQDAVALTIETMSKMIFSFGFVHLDPQPANLFIRKTPILLEDNNKNLPKFQLVILDHGLYRQLTPHIRQSYCLLWKDLVTQNDEGIKEQCEKLGIDRSLWEYLATSILMRPYRIDKLRQRILDARRLSSADQLKIFDDMAHSISSLILQLPRELLFVFRHQNYLRHINISLGQPVNRFRILAKQALLGIENQNKSYWGQVWENILFEGYLLYFDIQGWFYSNIFKLYNRISYLIYSEEDYIVNTQTQKVIEELDFEKL